MSEDEVRFWFDSDPVKPEFITQLLERVEDGLSGIIVRRVNPRVSSVANIDKCRLDIDLMTRQSRT